MDLQQDKMARRLLVGNISSATTTLEVANYFLNKYLSRNPNSETKPVVSVQLSEDKKAVLVDCTTTKHADEFRLFEDGEMFKDQSLRIKKLNNYLPLRAPYENKSHGAFEINEKTANISSFLLHSVAEDIKDGPDKIFVGNIEKYFRRADLIEMLDIISKVKSLKLISNSNAMENNLKYFFVEFIDTEISDIAILVLNGLPIAGRNWLAERHVRTKWSSYSPDYSQPVSVKYLMQNPSNILELSGILDGFHLLEDNDIYFTHLELDIKLECSHYGRVKSIHIPRLKNMKYKEHYCLVQRNSM